MSDYRYEIGYHINDCNRDLIIIDRERRLKKIKSKKYIKNYNQKWYKVKCNICGWDENWIDERKIYGKNKYHCSCCTSKIVIPGINDIATTHPDKVKFFANFEDCLTHTYGSSKYVEGKCPSCGDITLRMVNGIVKYNNYPCCKCGDGFSIPEKFIYNILRYCNVEFIHQLSSATFKWCGNYYYDFYIPKKKAIIEVNGLQHYMDKMFTTYKQQSKRDYEKLLLARNNGIKDYIIINASKSDFNSLKNELIEEKWLELLGIDSSNIDFEECYKNTCSSLVVEICKDFNNNPNQKLTDLAVKYQLSRATIRDYLKKGNIYGWCKFNMVDHKAEMVKNTGYLNAKPVEIFKGNKSLGLFKSTTDLSNKSIDLFGTKLNQPNINRICRGEENRYKGFTFRRIGIEEYNNRQSEWK